MFYFLPYPTRQGHLGKWLLDLLALLLVDVENLKKLKNILDYKFRGMFKFP